MKNQNGENTKINMLSNINSPFKETGRFDASFNTNPPVYTVELSINGVYIMTIVYLIDKLVLNHLIV